MNTINNVVGSGEGRGVVRNKCTIYIYFEGSCGGETKEGRWSGNEKQKANMTYETKKNRKKTR